MEKAYAVLSNAPEPFLGRLFEANVVPVIATGFKYHAAEVALHGVQTHNAIDLDLPRGTKILAPADGWYIATYGEVLLRQESGEPRTLSRKQALSGNPSNRDLNPPGETGEWPVWFGSFVIQGWHGNGRYTQYAHVDWIAPKIPYYPPVEVEDQEGNRTGDLKHSPMLKTVVSDYRKPGVAAFVTAGEVIGEVGMTGCGWGRRCFDSARFDQLGSPDFRGTDYTYYTEPHLHFAAFGRRAPRTRTAKPFDPFGIYGELSDGYPVDQAQWHVRQPGAKHQPLWLPQV
jgi:murein DD-endopeptidase MepM/ murein hydrolase activator NlpD